MSQDERYSRQIRFRGVGAEGQRRISARRVVLVGCGALGTHLAEYMARAGVGELRLIDRDLVEWSNLQRQIGFREEDAREARPKASALAQHLGAVNSTVSIDPRPVEFQRHAAVELAADADLILDGTDNLATRLLINDVAYRSGIPWIYGGGVEAEGVVQVIDGRSPPCLRCTIGSPPPPGTLPTCETAGVLGPAIGVVAAWQATLALRLLVEGVDGARELSGRQVRLRPWDLDARVVRVRPDPDCPTCSRRSFDFLEGREGGDVQDLCGRQAVQVRPGGVRSAGVHRVDLRTVAERLRGLGDVEVNELVLRLRTEEFTATLFPDGRAIFDGLTDVSRARSLYARLFGE